MIQRISASVPITGSHPVRETLEEFAKLPGVGKNKLGRYGTSFIGR